MMTFLKVFWTLLVASGLLMGGLSTAAGEPIPLGTGGKSGVYYPVGKAVAQVYNKNNAGEPIKVLPSKGSVDNLQALSEGKIKLAIAQADVAQLAAKGKLPFQKGKPYKNLRAIMALHVEDMTLVASKKSGIKKLTDLKGKRVAVGEPGSGTLQNVQLALSVVGMSIKDLGQAQKIGLQAASDKFKAGKLDAIFYFVGHPNKYIKQLSKLKNIKIRLIPIPGVINKILMKYDYYVLSRLSVIHYKGVLNRVGVETFGIKALLLTDKKTPDAVVSRLVNCVLDNFSQFKSQHKSLLAMKLNWLTKGVSVPFHPAAQKILKAKGL